MSLLSWWVGGPTDEEKATDLETTAKLKQLAWQKYQNGTYDLQTYNEVIARLDGSSAIVQNADEAISDAFVEGAKEGADNIAKTIQKTTDFALGSVWSFIPWQVKVGAVLVAAFYIWRFYKTAKAVTP